MRDHGMGDRSAVRPLIASIPLLVTAPAFAYAAMVPHGVRIGAVLLLVAAFGSLALVIVSARSRPIGLGGVFLILLLLFHVPLAVPLAFGLRPRQLELPQFQWIESDYLGQAFAIVALAVIVFTGSYFTSIAVSYTHLTLPTNREV